jgi:hypothetical protein
MFLLLLFYLGPDPYLRFTSICNGTSKKIKVEPCGSGLATDPDKKKNGCCSLELPTVIKSSHESGFRYRYLRDCA